MEKEKAFAVVNRGEGIQVGTESYSMQDASQLAIFEDQESAEVAARWWASEASATDDYIVIPCEIAFDETNILFSSKKEREEIEKEDNEEEEGE